MRARDRGEVVVLVVGHKGVDRGVVDVLVGDPVLSRRRMDLRARSVLRNLCIGNDPNGAAGGLQNRYSSGKGADLINVHAWGKLAETCGKHLSEGRLVACDGRLRVAEWIKRRGSATGSSSSPTKSCLHSPTKA